MAAIVMDGKALAEKVKEQVANEIRTMDKRPGLAVIIVGGNPASRIYVNHKKADCEACGIYSEEYALLETATQKELLDLIDTLNKRDDIHGILCQMPLPKGMDEQAVLQAISPEKDVDGFHPINVGKLSTGQKALVACTPAGVMEMLREYNIDPCGKECVVVGRSNIVGKPMAMLLLAASGTVTVCHSKTTDLGEICRRADILVAAVGVPQLITADMVRPGAVVIDVAMNRNDAGKLCGDVDYLEVAEKASYITPVPGGVGPMTRAMLMRNTVEAAKNLG